MDRYRKTADVDNDSPPSEAWLFAQALLGQPIPDPRTAARSAREERDKLERLAVFSPRHADELRKLENAEAEARRSRDALVWAAGICTEAETKLRDLLSKEAESQQAQRRWEQNFDAYAAITEWNEADHPRQPKGTAGGGQWTAKGGAGGGGAAANQAAAQTPAERVPPRPTVNSEWVEVAGAGPETTQTYRDKVQKALETLDPAIARWWKANSVSGQIHSRATGWWQSKARSWLDQDGRPVVEVDQNLTPGQTAQAIIDEVNGGLFAASIGASFKAYKFARSGDADEFRKWQQGATAEAAQLASVLAELYVSSIATLSPAGNLVVTLGDLAENGRRWDQLVSILPYVGHLPIAAIVVKLGQREVKIPKALARKFHSLSAAERKSILVAISNAKTDEDVATIIRKGIRELGPEHHLASNKNWVSTLRGGPWSSKFEPLFSKAGLTLDDAANIVRIPGHFGPHPEAYHDEILRRLAKATQGKRGAAYKSALLKELEIIADEARASGTKLSRLLTGQ